VGGSEVTFAELKKLLEAHGCAFHFNKKTQILTAARGVGAGYRRWSQHAHKGMKDTFDAYVLKVARRRLGLDGMPEQEFYAPLR
jgi:hypothetical protein